MKPYIFLQILKKSSLLLANEHAVSKSMSAVNI